MLKHLFTLLLLVLTSCHKETKFAKDDLREERREIKIAITEEPITFDPRQMRGLAGTTFMHGLYEGLVRHSKEGDVSSGISYGIAKHIEISEDQKTYRFFLRDAMWSDGTKVTAQDFVTTWKTILDPKFPAPNSYQLFVIEGAREFKEKGAQESKQVLGVKALDEETLEVKLHHPTPYFLDLLATHFFIPYKENVYNGPFTLSSYKIHEKIVFDKNPLYWDSNTVHLDRIEFLILDENTIVELFEKGEVDWIGSPQGSIPPDLIGEVELEHTLQSNPALGTHLIRVNIQKQALVNSDVRRSLKHAIDRKALVQYVTQGNHAPAWGIIPPSLGYITPAQPVLVTPIKVPTLTLSYAKSDANHAIAQAIQYQWQKNLGITIQLDKCETKCFFEKLKSKDYDLALGSWYGDYRDAYNFLELFKEKDISTNNTGWENEQYKELLERSLIATDPLERKGILQEAEKLLLQEAPIIPLYYGSFNSFKNPKLEGLQVSDLGYLDFKGARLE